jgi:hypothetical protein
MKPGADVPHQQQRRDLDKLRERDLLEPGSGAGAGGCVRLSVQYAPRLAGKTRAERREVLGCWAEEVGRALARHGGEVVPDSLSIAGQTVEAVVPAEEYPRVEAELAGRGERADLVVPRRAISGG